MRSGARASELSVALQLEKKKSHKHSCYYVLLYVLCSCYYVLLYVLCSMLECFDL